MSPQHFAGNGGAELLPILQRAMEVKAGIDARPKDFVDKVAQILKRVGVHSIRKRRAIGNEMRLGGAEVSRQHREYRSARAGMSRRILWVAARRAERKPAGIRLQIGIAASGRNGGRGPPERAGVIGVDTPDTRARVSAPQRGQQPR